MDNDVSTSSGDESDSHCLSERKSNFGFRKSRKSIQNPKQRFPNIEDYQWIRKAEDSSCQAESRTISHRSSKHIHDSNSSVTESALSNVVKQLHGPENSSGNEEFTHCDCTTCQEARFLEYQANRVRPKLKSCEAKVDITNESKEKFINIAKPKVVNPVIDRTVTKRLASANRDTINSLKGQINCLEIKLKELQKENATYKLIQYRQDKALTRYQGEFAELPTLIKNHKEELQGCRQLLKKAENKCRGLEETIKIRDKRIGKLQEENYKLGSFVNQYDMGNRYKLLSQLKDTKAKLRETEKKAEESSHHLEVLHKSQQQRSRQDSIRMKKADENLYKAHMRNVELRKYIEDQAERLKTYETLLLKTIRKNNLPIDMDELRNDALRNENANRPKTYILASEKNENLSICNKIDSNLYQEQTQSQLSITNTDTQLALPPQKIDRNTSPFSVVTNKDSFARMFNFEEEDDEVPTEILFAYQCMHGSESSMCPTDNCIPERENSPKKCNSSENQKSIQSLYTGKSGGDQEGLEKSLSKQEMNSRKNRYDAGDEAASNSVSFDDGTFIDGVHPERNHGNLCTQERYNNFHVEEENDCDVLQDNKTEDFEKCRNSKKILQLQNYKSHKPFFKISEEYTEKYFVDGKGRNKKSLAIMKRKNAIFHPLPMHVESLHIGKSSAKSQILHLNHNRDGLRIPFTETPISPPAEVIIPSMNSAGDENQISLNCNNYDYSHAESDKNTEYGWPRPIKAFLSHSR